MPEDSELFDPDLFGWFLGLGIGFAIIVVVVVIVATILTLAARIGGQVQEGIAALHEGRKNTLALWDLHHVNAALEGTLDAARRARELAEQKG